MSNRHLNFGEEQHAEINRGKGADVAQKAGEDFGKPSGPRTVLPLQPCALRAWRQPQGPFGSSLQLNNLLITIAEIRTLVLIRVWLIVVPSPPLVLLLHLPSSVPRLGWYDELRTAENKKANLEKRRWLRTYRPICLANSPLGHHGSLPPLDNAARAPRAGFQLRPPPRDAQVSWERRDSSRAKMKPPKARGNAFSANSHSHRTRCWEAVGAWRAQYKAALHHGVPTIKFPPVQTEEWV